MKCIAIEKQDLTLSSLQISRLQRAVLNERTLDECWISEKGWTACHLDNADLTRFVATAFLRYCRHLLISEVFLVDTIDLFRSMRGRILLRKISPSLDSISQACFGLPWPSEFNHPDYEWLLKKSFAPSLFFSPRAEAEMLLLRDASSCITIAGNQEFINCMTKYSRKIWISGVPRDGLSRPNDHR